VAQARAGRTLLSACRRRFNSRKQATAVTSSAPNGESSRSLERRGTRARFPRTLRLLRHADFERVYESSRRHFSASLTAFYLARPEAQSATAKASGLRVGFTVGRALGGAVQRNRIKRRMREAVRLSRPPVETRADVVINPKKSVLTADFETVLNEVRRAFVVIEQKLANVSPQGASPEGRSLDGTKARSPEGTTDISPGRKSGVGRVKRNRVP
jgi:ribonuclease P protein component